MNVSTAAAFIATGAGVRVAKHGNRSFTSRCGSADVLEALGVRIDHDADEAARLLATVGLAFLFAPRYHPAMRHVAPVRRELKVTTIMNLVGPLSNPAGVRRQVVGVAEEGRLPLMAGALARLEVEHALVVYAKVGMDEISPAGLTRVMEVRGREIQEWVLDPAEFDLDWESTDELAGGEPAENAERIRRLFEGRGREADRRAVLLNAAAAVYVSGVVGSYGDAVALAVEALASGRPRQVLGELSGEG
jgi:anthranilate phosphoribosyltransferase